MKVHNHYDFTDLSQCVFFWEYVKFEKPNDGRAGHTVLRSGNVAAPSAPPHGTAELTLNLPVLSGVEAVYLTAKNPRGQNLWTWSWPVVTVPAPPKKEATGRVRTRESVGQLAVYAGGLELEFNKTNGYLAGVNESGKIIPLSQGPRFIAYSHHAKGRGTVRYQDIAGTNSLASFTTHPDGNDLLVEAKYNGTFKLARWRISVDGQVRLNYTYAFDGAADLLGVNFDFPEADMKGITWLGYGPFHVWQNRLQGTRLDVWQNTYNDTIPSVFYSPMPEFKGYFRGWRWATFDTSAGKFMISTTETESYLGIYHPNDGPVGPLLALPKTGLTFLDVIPAMRDKFLMQESMGPQSAEKQVAGAHEGAVIFDFSGE